MEMVLDRAGLLTSEAQKQDADSARQNKYCKQGKNKQKGKQKHDYQNSAHR
jgi:hypothetical protein